uniref:Uncharacterized protein n=1 Tax=Setaria digitata TaxID=48799 RepID=A0A915Q8C3_9BILA
MQINYTLCRLTTRNFAQRLYEAANNLTYALRLILLEPEVIPSVLVLEAKEQPVLRQGNSNIEGVPNNHDSDKNNNNEDDDDLLVVMETMVMMCDDDDDDAVMGIGGGGNLRAMA